MVLALGDAARPAGRRSTVQSCTAHPAADVAVDVDVPVDGHVLVEVGIDRIGVLGVVAEVDVPIDIGVARSGLGRGALGRQLRVRHGAGFRQALTANSRLGQALDPGSGFAEPLLQRRAAVGQIATMNRIVLPGLAGERCVIEGVETIDVDGR